MIPWLALLAALGTAPGSLTIVGREGETSCPGPLRLLRRARLPAPQLLAALSASVTVGDGWAEVTIARQPFRFLLGAPFYVFSSKVQALAGPASVLRDTLFLPFQFVAEVLPYYLSERYRYDPKSARLEDLAGRPAAAAGARARPASACPTAFAPATSSP